MNKAIALTSVKAYILGVNGVNTFLQITDLEGNPLSAAITLSPHPASQSFAAQRLGIALSSTNAYIVSTNNQSTAIFQITDLNGNLIGNPVPISTIGGSFGCNIAIFSNKAYCIGSSNTAFLQITDLNGNLLGPPVSLSPIGGSAVGIALSSTKVYIAGNDGPGNAFLQITDLNGNLLGSRTNISSAIATNIALSSTKAYIVGQTASGNAFLQITDLNGNLLGSAITISPKVNADSAIAYNIALSSTKAYIIGRDAQGNAFLQITDLNGNLLGSPTIISPATSITQGIAIYPPNWLSPTQTIFKSYHQYNNLIPLKGY